MNRRFGGARSPHLQGRRIKQSRNQLEEGRKQSNRLCQNFRLIFFDAEDGDRYVPTKRRLNFNGLHGVISQKIELFITSAVRTSIPRNPRMYLLQPSTTHLHRSHIYRRIIITVTLKTHGCTIITTIPITISRYSDWLRAGRVGGLEFESRWGQQIFTSPYRPDRLWGPPNLL
jgi:hypothetical protein